MNSEAPASRMVSKPPWWTPMLMVLVLANIFNFGIFCRRLAEDIADMHTHSLSQTVSRSEILPIAINVFLVNPVLTLFFWWSCRRLLRRRRATAGLCQNCGYDLRESPIRCPECGLIVPQK